MPPSQDNNGSVKDLSKYEQAMAYIAELAPRGWRLGLDRMEEFINLSGSLNQNITKKPKFIQIAGTNGKGSTTAMVQSCLVEQEYATGAFYSPYVVEPRERIQFGRDMISEEELSKIRPDLDGAQVMELLNIKPSAAVGKALDFLLELRLENGPLGQERATKELLDWWIKENPSAK